MAAELTLGKVAAQGSDKPVLLTSLDISIRPPYL